MVKLRLKRMGKIDTPFYRIVVLDSRKKRDGAYIESLGYYDPKTDPLTLKVDTDKAIEWLQKGAQPSDTVRSLLRKAGVLEKWHNLKMGVTEEKEKETEVDKTAKKKTEEKDTDFVVKAEKIEEQPVVEAEEKETKPVAEKIEETPVVETEKKETSEEKDIEEK
ncbi:MAG: 30S ribosomal protein S16 [Candidatus Cloacimonetes bacterium]|nr:30S ribosomal protein S16 [Candidatus Cloacimonadota bacterium]